MRIVLAEDDDLLGRALVKGLQDAGHVCEWKKNGADALQSIHALTPEAVVLDLMLPGMNGMEVLRTLRQEGDTTPILVLTALGSVDDRVEGLRSGADDYLAKPFAFAELLARLDAITRRSSGDSGRMLRAGSLSLDLATRRVQRSGHEVELTPTEFSLLEFLMRHVNKVVTRKMLCEHLWHADWEGVTNVIEVHITRLRAKIDRDFGEPLLHTVRGQGYMIRNVGT